jgi:hypothetical protein
MATRPIQHAAPPDAAGHQGSFERDNNSLVEPSDNDLPGATWESPRQGEQPVKHDLGLWFTMGLALLSTLGLFAYCMMPAP